MAAASPSELTPEQIGLEATVMAIREEIMSYFKGGCISRVTDECPLNMIDLKDYLPEARYSYQRRQREQERARMLLLAGAPIVTLRSNPDSLTFHTGVLQRSAQFQAIYQQIDKFMDTFLKSIRKEVNDAAVILR